MADFCHRVGRVSQIRRWVKHDANSIDMSERQFPLNVELKILASAAVADAALGYMWGKMSRAGRAITSGQRVASASPFPLSLTADVGV